MNEESNPIGSVPTAMCIGRPIPTVNEIAAIEEFICISSKIAMYWRHTDTGIPGSPSFEFGSWSGARGLMLRTDHFPSRSVFIYERMIPLREIWPLSNEGIVFFVNEIAKDAKAQYARFLTGLK